VLPIVLKPRHRGRPGVLNDASGRMIRKLSVSHAFVVSAYYYPKSSLLGNNAIALNVVFDSVSHNLDHVIMIGTNDTEETQFVARTQVESSEACRYATTVATANTVENLTKLEIESNDHKIEIPFKVARTSAPAPVVICVSPQFAAEQWQLLVVHAHVARYFGGHIHLYVTSLVDSFYDLAVEYEKHGYITLDFWMRLKFANASKDAVEPNLHAELRNQAGAESDCLLQYKEAAAFIMFFDLDDILIPRGFNNYFDEITSLYKRHPRTQTFQYTKRELLTYNKPTVEDINIKETLGHVWFVNEEDYGKIITDPSKLNSMWIHQSWNVKKNYISRTNYIIHLQKPVDPDGHDPVSYRRSDFDEMISMKFNTSILDPIQEDLERFINSTKLPEISKRLPKKTFYFPIIYRCYFEKFYRRPKKDSCPNGEGCQMPQRHDINCVNADADFKSGPPMNPITYHYHVNTRWTKQKGC
ncbi:Protein CBG21991, partial [Caenorhabditis briggsae]